jgi:hypothetical protein
MGAISSFLVLKKKNKAPKKSLLAHEDVVFPQKWYGLRGYRDLWVKAQFPCPPNWWTDFAMG